MSNKRGKNRRGRNPMTEPKKEDLMSDKSISLSKQEKVVADEPLKSEDKVEVEGLKETDNLVDKDLLPKSDTPVHTPGEVSNSETEVAVAQAQAGESSEELSGPDTILLAFLKDYAVTMGAENGPSREQIAQYQRQLYSHISGALQMETNAGTVRLSMIVNFIQSCKTGAFDIRRIYRGLGDPKVIKDQRNAEEARELFTVITTLANPALDNSKFLSWANLRDLIPAERVEQSIAIFKAVAGDSNE